MKRKNCFLARICFLLIVGCYLSSCSQHGQGSKKGGDVSLDDTIKQLVEQLSKETEFHAGIVGIAGKTTQQYILSDSLWHVATTEQLAHLALSHPSPVVRLSASYGLMERDPHIAAEIAIEGILDTAMCRIVNGCISRCSSVSEDRLITLRVNREYYGLSAEDSIRLDSAILYKPYYDKYDRDIMAILMESLVPRPQYYERLKEMYQKEHCIYAMIGIAKYQRAPDMQLMTDMAKRAIRLMQEKHDKLQKEWEKYGDGEIVLEVEEEDDIDDNTCKPPQESSGNNADEVFSVVIKSTSFWPNKKLIRIVQPLREYNPYLYDRLLH